MFGFFGNKKTPCPVSEDTRLWIENSLIWLIKEFGEEKFLSVKTLLPVPENFPVQLDNTERMAYDLLAIVARQMDVEPGSISLDFYNEQLFEIRGDAGFTLYGQQFDNEKYSAGLYYGEGPGKKYSIALELGQLKHPHNVVATLAHEIAHIKLLGEGRLEENDEHLTDLVTVFFGLGIFNANSSFNFQADYEKWSYSKQGYLLQQEWGYALALYAYIRRETKPDWLKYLTKNIQSDFKKSSAFIDENTDKVLV